ncbi:MULTISPECIES: hypothetical protein [unclassified Carboxylicivirga]|uniref:hypothetical protein n=1 Tax=Carboxylicivirga TaxID=1628153 RepID=UPI003D32CEEC
MNQINKIEAQYLKFIGVTLLMAAACMPDSTDEKSRFLACDDVREIILEQFNSLSAAHRQEVIDWENAIKEVSELPQLHCEVGEGAVYQVLSTNQILPTFIVANALLRRTPNVEALRDGQQYGFNPEQSSTACERIRHSLITRAGPLA